MGEVCKCGHAKDQHSGARGDDFGCNVPGCYDGDKCSGWDPMTPAVPDPTVEALDMLGRYLQSRARTAKALGREDREWLGALILLDKARAAAPDALRVAVEAALADSRNQWWHTGGTPCIPRRVIRALLDDPALAGRATGGER